METEKRCTSFVKRITVFFSCHLTLGAFLTAVLDAFYKFFIVHNTHPETWYVPYAMVVPFDRSTYLGYLGLFGICVIAGFTYIWTLSATCTYFVNCCFYIEACMNHFKDYISDINQRIQNGTYKPNENNAKEDFKNAIMLHIKALE